VLEPCTGLPYNFFSQDTLKNMRRFVSLLGIGFVLQWMNIEEWRLPNNIECVMPGFRHHVIEVFALLGCYASLIDRCRRFEFAYGSRLQGSGSLPLNIGPIGCSETSVTINQHPGRIKASTKNAFGKLAL